MREHECCRCGGMLGEMLEDGWLPCYHCGTTGKCSCHKPDIFYVTVHDQEGNIVGKSQYASGADEIRKTMDEIANMVRDASIIKESLLNENPDMDHRDAAYMAIARTLIMRGSRSYFQIQDYLRMVSDYQLSSAEARAIVIKAMPEKDRIYHTDPDDIPF